MQVPNAPLLIALVADLVGYLTRGEVQGVANWVARLAFAIWAVMEIGWGVNPFRRILGGIVLALVSFAFYKQLSLAAT